MQLSPVESSGSRGTAAERPAGAGATGWLWPALRPAFWLSAAKAPARGGHPSAAPADLKSCRSS